VKEAKQIARKPPTHPPASSFQPPNTYSQARNSPDSTEIGCTHTHTHTRPLKQKAAAAGRLALTTHSERASPNMPRLKRFAPRLNNVYTCTNTHILTQCVTYADRRNPQQQRRHSISPIIFVQRAAANIYSSSSNWNLAREAGGWAVDGQRADVATPLPWAITLHQIYTGCSRSP
jgi:hypothetical protein